MTEEISQIRGKRNFLSGFKVVDLEELEEIYSKQILPCCEEKWCTNPPKGNKKSQRCIYSWLRYKNLDWMTA